MSHNRRTFIKNTGLILGGSIFPFSNIYAQFGQKQLGVCLVGLGTYSTQVLAPALQLTKNCKLTGIVTGTPSKVPIWQKKYGIEDKNVYDYQSMDQIANNPDIDVVYIVLPTGLHAQYAIKAANLGKHVWCEKPMAKTETECQAIIFACKSNNVRLSIGYRMQHEPNTQQIIRWANSNPYGAIKTIKAELGYHVKKVKRSWRTNKKLGGGTMYDLGVYPLNAARYATCEEPISVTAKHINTRTKIFDETDETTHFDLEFPSGIIANCKTSVASDMHLLQVDCEKGWYKLEPFSMYSGIKGITSDGKKLDQYIENQQAKQMDDDAWSIMNGQHMLVPGEEGTKDIRIVEAIYRAAASGEKVML